MKRTCCLLLALCLCLAIAPAAHAEGPAWLAPLSEEGFASAAWSLGMGGPITLAESKPELGLSYTEQYAEYPTRDAWYFGSIQRIVSDDPASTSYLADALCSYYLEDIGYLSQSVYGDNYRGTLFAVDTAHTRFTPRFSAVLQVEDVILVLDFSALGDLRAAMNALGYGALDIRFLENYDDVQPLISSMLFGMAMESYGYRLTADLSGSGYPQELCYSAGIRAGESYDALCVRAQDRQQADSLFNQLFWELDSSSPISLSVHYGDNYQSVLLNDPGFLLRVEDSVYLVFCGSVDNLDGLQAFLGLRLRGFLLGGGFFRLLVVCISMIHDHVLFSEQKCCGVGRLPPRVRFPC